MLMALRRVCHTFQKFLLSAGIELCIQVESIQVSGTLSSWYLSLCLDLWHSVLVSVTLSWSLALCPGICHSLLSLCSILSHSALVCLYRSLVLCSDV